MARNTGNRKALLFAALILVCMFTYLPLTASAHPGGTDANGGHHDYNNVSGLGDYHYHHGYPAHLHENGVCPYDYVDLTGQSYGSSSSSGIKSGAATTEQLLEESIQREKETEQRAIAAETRAELADDRAATAEADLGRLRRRDVTVGVIGSTVLLLLFLLLRRCSIIGKADHLRIKALEEKISFYEELFPRLKELDNMPRRDAREYVRQERARRSRMLNQDHNNDI